MGASRARPLVQSGTYYSTRTQAAPARAADGGGRGDGGPPGRSVLGKVGLVDQKVELAVKTGNF